MPKELLTGTLEEQCAFLYSMATEKMAEGNYTGAIYALKEIIKHQPDYRDASVLMAEAKQRKAQQNRLVFAGFLGAALFVGIGTIFRLSNDLFFLVLAVVGAIVGYTAGLLLFGQKTIEKKV